MQIDRTTPLPLAAIDVTALPAGTTVARQIGDTTFYRAEWLIAVSPSGTFVIGDAADAAKALDQLATVETRAAELRRQVEQLEAARATLLEQLLPPAPPKRPRKERKAEAAVPPVEGFRTIVRAPVTDEMITCAVDGCQEQRPVGSSIQMHRQRAHADWYAWQLALTEAHPLKADRRGAITPEQAQAPAPEVAADPTPFTQASQAAA